MDPRFGEFFSCCCLPHLPQLAWKILATWGPLFSLALYSVPSSQEVQGSVKMPFPGSPNLGMAV